MEETKIHLVILQLQGKNLFDPHLQSSEPSINMNRYLYERQTIDATPTPKKLARSRTNPRNFGERMKCLLQTDCSFDGK